MGSRRPSSSDRRGDNIHEDALRAQLTDDPNNAAAFQALAEIVRRHAAESTVMDDPLAAPVDPEERERAEELAVWALAEELAGNPRGWYPLVELGRLSLDDDTDGALRRFATAAERDPSGRALAESVAVLSEAGLQVEALGLGVGHWRAREHVVDAGRQLVLAALAADRTAEARQYLDFMEAAPDKAALAKVRPELEKAVALSEQHHAGT
ncbi:hypothetical protein GCM10025865_25590 [Paraoerskovia sediminicola]|uniref:Tetratricopeptide repeat protein n=1 Tax=Paraoerskovia sediminicola TaxID=1138587 RepID=A0ABM8G505_9CELL|nr:hypothetical protein GCM10025865_25590 [Paraoerskovia sediminicola]